MPPGTGPTARQLHGHACRRTLPGPSGRSDDRRSACRGGVVRGRRGSVPCGAVIHEVAYGQFSTLRRSPPALTAAPHGGKDHPRPVPLWRQARNQRSGRGVAV
jgi:hypothetical protein